MEHPCYRCQASIEEGTTFCPHCGAPQIRVVQPENNESPPPGEFPAPNPPLSPPTTAWQQPGTPYLPQPNAIQWELAWKGALLAGAAAAALTAIPYVSMGCCLWMLGAGALSVALYQRHVPGAFITPGMGMKLGALAGVFGFVINAIMTTASFVMFRANPDFRRALQEQMEKSMAGNSDPKVQEMMQRIVQFMSSPQGVATLIVFTLLFMAVMFLVFTAAGGALGASMTGRQRQFR